jgi:uncharacterized repeat protein (TIGR02543 family)
MRNKVLLLSWVLLFIAIALFSVVTAESVVCEIVGGSAYATLQEALDDINTGDTVKLRNNIEHRDTIEVNGKTINFDLNGYTLDVTVTTGDAIVVGSGGIITIDDTAGGELNASGGIRGVYAHDGGEATVTNAIRLNNPGYFGEENCAAYAENYGEIIVKNDATGQSSSSYGAYAYNRGTITVEGNCTGVYVGAQADGYGSVIVEGNSTGAFRGSWATNHGTIEVQGDSVGTATGNSAGAEAEGDSEITIYGDAIGLTYGVIADRSSITVHGDCSATETYTGIGVDASSSPTNVTVKGNVYGRDYGVHSTDGPQIRVEGNVQSDSCAVLGYYGRIDILGNVISGNIGIDLYAGNIYVEETVSAPKYIILATVEKNASDGVIDGRYYKYSDSFANAYIRIPPVINSVSSDKSFIISAGGDLNVSVSGINMPEDVIVAAFNGDIKVTEASAEGDDLSKTAILMFPPAEDDIDIVCTIKASMDGGLTWAEAIDSVTLRHAPVLVTNITVSSESDVTTLFTGNPLQLTAVVTPSDADCTDVTWNVIPGTGDASITSTGLLTGTSEGTVTVEATATDDSEIKGTIEITFLTKPVMSGTINISGAAKYNEVLSVDVSGITYTPDTSDDVCTIQWKRNGTNISGATGNTYRLVQADIGCVITVTVSADGVNATGSVSSEPTSVVEKQDGPPAPEPPALSYKTHNSVHLVVEPGMAYQREGDSSWYAYADFTGLSPDRTYAFRAKIYATATRKESPASEPLYVTTDPMPSHNVTYYPNDGEETPAITDSVQEGITYSVTYHSNYGSGNTFSADGLPMGEIFEVAECTFDPPYMKRFKEWNTNPYGEGDTYNVGDSILMPSGGLDLYAIWELATYKVIYDGNGSTGGSEPIDSNEYTFGTYATILSYGTLSKAGYKFIGWNTEADGTGTLYQAGYNYYMEAEDITFYAQWEPYIEDDFTDPNFKQAVWEWLGNPVGSTPGNFTKQDLSDGMGPFKDLYLSYRGITSLAGLEHFSDTGLKYLVVNDNQLTVIPELPGTLKSLSCYNNQLICLPELPDTIEDLYCYNNQLTSLPELPDSLESLYCYSNLLTSLPELPESLENLLCQENQLTTLPQLPAGLKTLSCGNNELEYLPELPEGIESITCWVNKLESLPDLPDSLKSLQCSYNRITSLPSIPESMETLYCTNNLLTDLPEIPEGLFLSASENFMDVTKDPIKFIIDNFDGTKYVTPQLRYLSYVSGIELETGSNYSIASRIYKRSLYDSISYSDSVATNLSDFAFVSSDENVATVNEAGIITAVGNGNCTITALFKDYDSEFTKVEFQVNAYTFYSITYYSNGGTGDPPAAVQVRGGTNFEPAANSMTPPEAMRLKEWNTAADGSGDSYIPGITYTMPNRNLSLYAIWEVIPTYTVTYDGNGSVTGAVPTDSNIYYEGDYAVIADSGDLAKPGYKFGGWSDSPDGSGWLYQAGESLRIDEENVILYAQWSLVITNDFTDINFRQAVWEWLGNPVGSTPGDFSELDLKLRAEEGAYLDVSAREIESLAGFEHFRDTYLYALICNDNKLTELPELPDFLQGLSCSENQLKSLPDLPEYLQILICGDNAITSLPNLPEYMFYLVCDNNLLCELPQLPEDMMLLSFAGNYIQDVNRPDIEIIIENGGLVTAYPQQKFGGHEEDIKLKEGENFSIADKFYTQSYDGTAWSEIVPFTDISLLNFSSSDNSIVTVSDTGVMTGVRKGKCQITVLLGNNDSPYTKVVFDVEVTRRATAGNTGNTSVPPAPATDIMDNIRTESKDNGLVVANISVTSPTGANSVEFTLPKTVTKQLTESNIDILTINTQIANFSISKAELAAISGESDGDIDISASIVDLQTLSEETRAVIGDRPVYSFEIRVGDRTISQFTDAIILSVPYAIREGEDPEAIVIYYINAQGQLELITDCLYDEQTGMVTFSTDHFSKFAVGYNKITFDDVDENAWYSKAVAFAAARGITQGIGNNCFGPEVKLTRGQFIVMLMKAYGIEPDIDPSDNFADAGNTFYTGYLAAAKRLGISAGIGNNMYGPENEITRQEMVTLAYNTLKLLGKFPAVPIDALPGDFTDKDRVAIWAREAMDLFVRAGIINGSGGSLNPDDVTNRAQMVQVLYKLRGK